MKHVTIIHGDKGGVGKTLVNVLTANTVRDTELTKKSLVQQHNGEMHPHPKGRHVNRRNASAIVGCDHGRRISRRP